MTEWPKNIPSRPAFIPTRLAVYAESHDATMQVRVGVSPHLDLPTHVNHLVERERERTRTGEYR